MFAHGLNPIPTNFTDQGTIPKLQETFLFWRIAKGGPGLPDEGGPWDSAMPAWEKFLTEEEIWDVILFLYDHTGYGRAPRKRRALMMRAAILAARSRSPRPARPRAPPRSGHRRAARRGQEALRRSSARSATATRATATGSRRAHLMPRPRDFTTGKFKIRTTPSGALPTDDDLKHIIQRRHAVHLDAGLAAAHRRRARRAVVLPEDVLAGLRRTPTRKAEADQAARRRRRYTQGVGRSAGARSTTSLGCVALPRRARPRRRHLGADAEGRLRATRSGRPT